MKRQDILEIIVSNPQAIFQNGNRVAGKYSEYPTFFQVASLSDDKSCVYVKGVGADIKDYLVDENGRYLRDENDHVIPDTRPVAERVTISHGSYQSMPTRLILKTDITEQEMIDGYIAEEEKRAREIEHRQAQHEKAKVGVEELKELFTTLGITDTGGGNADYYGRTVCQFDSDNIARLISALKSALVEVGV
jgi:hypothetical protein